MAAPSRGLKPYARPYGGPGFDVLETAVAAIERYRMVGPGDAVVVALSGGPDSTCLLDVMARLVDKLDLTLLVAHVDHGLSAASTEIAGRVSSRTAAAGYEVHTTRAPSLEGPNLHARARDFRYAFFDVIAEKEGAKAIATGHTLDDRVETLLARLVHGAGTSALAGIPPMEGRRIRPLIGLRRSETRAYCEAVGLAFDDDPGNADDRFERSAIRAKVVPAIEDRWGDGGVRAIARSSERLREDGQALNVLGARLYRDLAATNDEGLQIEMEPLQALPRALRRRVLELCVGRVRDRAGGIEAALDALEVPPAEMSGKAHFDVASGIVIEVERDRVSVLKAEEPDEPTDKMPK